MSLLAFVMSSLALLAFIWVILDLGIDREPFSYELSPESPDRLLVYNAARQLLTPRVVDGGFSKVDTVETPRGRILIAGVDFTAEGKGEDAGKVFTLSQHKPLLGRLYTREDWQPLGAPVNYEGEQLGIVDFVVRDLNSDNVSDISLVAAPKLGRYTPSLLLILNEKGELLTEYEYPEGRLEAVTVLKLSVQGSERTVLVVSGWQLARTFWQSRERTGALPEARSNPGEAVGPGGPQVYGVLMLFRVDVYCGKPSLSRMWSMKVEPLGFGIFDIKAEDRDKNRKYESITFWHQAGLKYAINLIYGLDKPMMNSIEGRILEHFLIARDSVCFELFDTDAVFDLKREERTWCDKPQ